MFVKLGDIAEVLLSNVDKKSKTNEQKIKLCNFVDVYKNYAITKKMIPLFLEATASPQAIRRFTVKKGYLAITKDSETRDDIGVGTYFADDFDNVILGYHCALIKPDTKKVYSKYLNAFIQSYFTRKYYEQSASGSGQRYTLTLEIIQNTPILLPDYEKQIIIGDLLSGLDFQIEKNNEMVTKLQDLARLIYERFFYHFTFPNFSSTDFSFDPTLKRTIPKDWKAVKVKDCIDHIVTGLNPRDNFILNDGEIKYITVKNITTEGQLDFSDCDTINESTRQLIRKRSKLSRGDILFASIAPLGRCYLVEDTPYSWEINESVFSIKPNSLNVSSEYLYLFFMSRYFIKKAEHGSIGSVFNGIRISFLEEMDILIPPKEIMTSFTKAVSPLLRLKYLVSQNNCELSKLKNKLMPLLINQQLL
ncbi:MAG TPA: restriction endonuclease subunit S [Bacilli bacterium]|nr:restriction endonuclease subunit S [Bacilli bacterium]